MFEDVLEKQPTIQELRQGRMQGFSTRPPIPMPVSSGEKFKSVFDNTEENRLREIMSFVLADKSDLTEHHVIAARAIRNGIKLEDRTHKWFAHEMRRMVPRAKDDVYLEDVLGRHYIDVATRNKATVDWLLNPVGSDEYEAYQRMTDSERRKYISERFGLQEFYYRLGPGVGPSPHRGSLPQLQGGFEERVRVPSYAFFKAKQDYEKGLYKANASLLKYAIQNEIGHDLADLSTRLYSADALPELLAKSYIKDLVEYRGMPDADRGTSLVDLMAKTLPAHEKVFGVKEWLSDKLGIDGLGGPYSLWNAIAFAELAARDPETAELMIMYRELDAGQNGAPFVGHVVKSLNDMAGQLGVSTVISMARLAAINARAISKAPLDDRIGAKALNFIDSRSPYLKAAMSTPMPNYGFVERSAVQAITTIPYMVVAMAPGGPIVIASHFGDDIYNSLVSEGVNPTEAIATSYMFGTAAAMVERGQGYIAKRYGMSLFSMDKKSKNMFTAWMFKASTKLVAGTTAEVVTEIIQEGTVEAGKRMDGTPFDTVDWFSVVSVMEETAKEAWLSMGMTVMGMGAIRRGAQAGSVGMQVGKLLNYARKERKAERRANRDAFDNYVNMDPMTRHEAYGFDSRQDMANALEIGMDELADLLADDTVEAHQFLVAALKDVYQKYQDDDTPVSVSIDRALEKYNLARDNARPADVSGVENFANAMRAVFGLSDLDIHIHESKDTVPDGVNPEYRGLWMEGKDGARDAVHVMLYNNKNLRQARGALIHEVIGHHLEMKHLAETERTLFTLADELFGLDGIIDIRSVEKLLPKSYSDMKRSMSENVYRAVIAGEFLAHVAEKVVSQETLSIAEGRAWELLKTWFGNRLGRKALRNISDEKLAAEFAASEIASAMRSASEKLRVAVTGQDVEPDENAPDTMAARLEYEHQPRAGFYDQRDASHIPFINRWKAFVGRSRIAVRLPTTKPGGDNELDVAEDKGLVSFDWFVKTFVPEANQRAIKPNKGGKQKDSLTYKRYKKGRSGWNPKNVPLAWRLRSRLDGMPVLRHLRDIEDHGEFFEEAVRFFHSNMKYIVDLMDHDIIERSRHWYVGANRFARDLSAKYGISIEASCGVLASLSPQKDWFMNASQAERVIAIYQQIKEGNIDVDDAIEAKVRKLFEPSSRTAHTEEDIEAFGRRDIKLRDMSEVQIAMAIWAFDESYLFRGYPVFAPEGHIHSIQMNEGGDKFTPHGWSGISSILAGMRAIDGHSIYDISEAISTKHKVRSFYNNILDPWSMRGEITSDTHNLVAAVFLGMGGTGFGSMHRVQYDPWTGERVKLYKGWAMFVSEWEGDPAAMPRRPAFLKEEAKKKAKWDGKEEEDVPGEIFAVYPNGKISLTDKNGVEWKKTAISPVNDMFSGAAHGDTGTVGTYFLYHEAVRRLSEEYGLSPREMQSVVWEGIRGLFPSPKRSRKKIQNETTWADAMDEVYELRQRRGDMTEEEFRKAEAEIIAGARREIVNYFAGNANDVPWLGAPSSRNVRSTVQAWGAHHKGDPAISFQPAPKMNHPVFSKWDGSDGRVIDERAVTSITGMGERQVDAHIASRLEGVEAGGEVVLLGPSLKAVKDSAAAKSGEIIVVGPRRDGPKRNSPWGVAIRRAPGWDGAKIRKVWDVPDRDANAPAPPPPAQRDGVPVGIDEGTLVLDIGGSYESAMPDGANYRVFSHADPATSAYAKQSASGGRANVVLAHSDSAGGDQHMSLRVAADAVAADGVVVLEGDWDMTLVRGYFGQATADGGVVYAKSPKSGLPAGVAMPGSSIAPNTVSEITGDSLPDAMAARVDTARQFASEREIRGTFGNLADHDASLPDTLPALRTGDRTRLKLDVQTVLIRDGLKSPSGKVSEKNPILKRVSSVMSDAEIREAVRSAQSAVDKFNEARKLTGMSAEEAANVAGDDRTLRRMALNEIMGGLNAEMARGLRIGDEAAGARLRLKARAEALAKEKAPELPVIYEFETGSRMITPEAEKAERDVKRALADAAKAEAADADEDMGPETVTADEAYWIDRSPGLRRRLKDLKATDSAEFYKLFDIVVQKMLESEGLIPENLSQKELEKNEVYRAAWKKSMLKLLYRRARELPLGKAFIPITRRIESLHRWKTVESWRKQSRSILYEIAQRRIVKTKQELHKELLDLIKDAVDTPNRTSLIHNRKRLHPLNTFLRALIYVRTVRDAKDDRRTIIVDEDGDTIPKEYRNTVLASKDETIDDILASLRGILVNPPDSYTDSDLEDVRIEIQAIEQYGGIIRNGTTDEIALAIQNISQMINEDNERILKIQEQRSEYGEYVGDIAKGAAEAYGSIRRQTPNAVAALDFLSKSQTIVSVFESMYKLIPKNSPYYEKARAAFTDIGEVIAFASLESRRSEYLWRESYTERIFEALGWLSLDEINAAIDDTGGVARLAAKKAMLGWKLRAWAASRNKPDPKLSRFSIKKTPQPMTRTALMAMYAQLRQPDVQEKTRDVYNAKGTLVHKGNAEMARQLAMLPEIESELTAEEKAVVDAVVMFMRDEVYPILSDAHYVQTGRDLGLPSSLYFPLDVEVVRPGMSGRVWVYDDTGSPFQVRRRHQNPLNENQNFFAVMEGNIAEASRHIFLRPVINKETAWFKRTDVVRAMKDAYGDKFVDALGVFLQNIGSDSRAPSMKDDALDTVRGLATLVGLSGRVVVTAKQATTSAPALFFDHPARNVMKAITDTFEDGEYIRMMKRILHDDRTRARFGVGYNEALLNMARQVEGLSGTMAIRALTNYLQVGMVGTKAADLVPGLVFGPVLVKVYMADTTRGPSDPVAREEWALRKMFVDIEMTQTSSLMAMRSRWDRDGDSAARLFTSFLSAVMLYASKAAPTHQKILTVRPKHWKDVMDWDDGRKMFMNHIVLPGAFVIADALFRWLFFGEEPDEGTIIKLAVACLTGPMSGMFILASVVVAGMSRVIESAVTGKGSRQSSAAPAGAELVADIGGTVAKFSEAMHSTVTGDPEVSDDWMDALSDLLNYFAMGDGVKIVKRFTDDDG